MASKLNAFLASVPANASAPSPPKSAPASLAFPPLELKAAPSSVGSFGPTTPQPPMPRYRQSSLRKFNPKLQLALECKNNHSNQESDRPEDERDVAQPSPLKNFLAAQAIAARRKEEEDVDSISEAGPLRLSSRQGSHHRRVSTDTTLFSRSLRQQTDRDISQDIVQHFVQIPVITATAAAAEALDNEMNVDNNAEEEHIPHVLEPEEVLALFRLGNTLPVASAVEIVRRATALMALEQNVISLRAPYTLVGDLHGQFQDLVELFRVHGIPAIDNPFLFLGDYVDRGVSSCEIILLLLSFKLAFPDSVHLLRGNHECRSLSTFYGFRTECLKKYGPVLYNRMVKCFESMPLAARLETAHGTFLAVHGGLSPDIRFVDDINGIVNRFMEPEPTGALCDLLWSDPAKEEAQEQEWVPNGMRGCSFTFNERACRDFLERNGLLAIIRAHELEADGYREHFCHSSIDGQVTLPAVITVFSAPEYCNTNDNTGATLTIPWEKQNGRLLQYQQHKRSQYAEMEFTRPSEEEAVKAFLEENLPFLPLDFYELVSLCRQLRFTLERAASTTSQIPCGQPSVPESKLPAQIEEYVQESPPSQAQTVELEDKDEEVSSVDVQRTVDESLDHGEKKSVVNKSKKAKKKEVKEQRLKEKMEMKHKKKKDKEKKKWDTSRLVSGWKFCPGFVRFYDRYFARDNAKSSVLSTPGRRSSWLPLGRTSFKRSVSTGEQVTESETVDTVTDSTGPVRRKSMTDWMPIPSFEQVAQLTSTLQGHIPIQTSGINLFTRSQWQALKLYFSILDLDASGVLMEESFVVLLAEQDSDAYATEDELSLLMEVMDCNADGMITATDFLLFAYRALLRWKKALHGSEYQV